MPDAPAFGEPWQARLFALTMDLAERGVFGWPEWTAALADARSGASDDGEAAYWHDWMRALDGLLSARGIARPGEVEAVALRWQAAAARTPHGQPVQLDASI